MKSDKKRQDSLRQNLMKAYCQNESSLSIRFQTNSAFFTNVSGPILSLKIMLNFTTVKLIQKEVAQLR